MVNGRVPNSQLIETGVRVTDQLWPWLEGFNHGPWWLCGGRLAAIIGDIFFYLGID